MTSRMHDLLDHHDNYPVLSAIQDAEQAFDTPLTCLEDARQYAIRDSGLYWRLKGIHARLDAVRDELKEVLRGHE